MPNMTKKKRIVITATAIVTVLILLASVLCFKFLYLPSDLNEGINDDPRFMIWYWNYENYIYKNGGTVMPFRLKSPKKVEEGKNYPLAVFLHGGGSHGMDNTKSMCGFYLNNIKKYAPEECYVLVPQVSDESRGWDENMIDTIEKLMVEYLLKNYNIDENRIYLSGSSMGGRGSIQYISRYPERFAALMFDAGAIPYKSNVREEIEIDYNSLVNIPMTISHGRLDASLPIESILRFTDNLKAAGNENINLIIYEDRGHETTDLFYTKASRWEWLFAQSRSAAI